MSPHAETAAARSAVAVGEPRARVLQVDAHTAVVERVLRTCRAQRMPFGTVPRDRPDLRRQLERGCQLITVAPIEWGIQAARETVEELGKVRPGGA